MRAPPSATALASPPRRGICLVSFEQRRRTHAALRSVSRNKHVHSSGTRGRILDFSDCAKCVFSFVFRHVSVLRDSRHVKALEYSEIDNLRHGCVFGMCVFGIQCGGVISDRRVRNIDEDYLMW